MPKLDVAPLLSNSWIFFLLRLLTYSFGVQVVVDERWLSPCHFIIIAIERNSPDGSYQR